jgi:hypothetical protein
MVTVSRFGTSRIKLSNPETVAGGAAFFGAAFLWARSAPGIARRVRASNRELLEILQRMKASNREIGSSLRVSA